jgi:hypothetical protein
MVTVLRVGALIEWAGLCDFFFFFPTEFYSKKSTTPDKTSKLVTTKNESLSLQLIY